MVCGLKSLTMSKELVKQPSLEKLIEILDDTAQMLFHIPESEFEVSPLEAKSLLPEKVEARRKFFEHCEKEAEYLRKKAHEMTLAARALENLSERMNTKLANKIVEHKFERLPGIEKDLVAKPGERIEIDDIEITPQIFEEYYDYIKVDYSFKGADLKEAILKQGKEFPFARINRDPKAKFVTKRKK